jgi:VanZ like family
MTGADWLSKPWRRTFLVALPVAVILATTATPSEGTGRDTPLSCLLCPPVGQRAGVDFVLNVLLYIPLGFALTRARTPPLAALLAAGLLSAAIEALQIEIIDGRFASTLDVVTNVLGAGLGILLGLRALLAPSARAAAALAIVAGGFWMGTVAATAWLLRPAIPTEAVIVRLTPRPRARATGAGELIDAALGGRTLPAGRVEWRTGDRELFASGVAPLQLRFIPNPRVEGPDPRIQLLASDGERRLLVGQSGNDLVFQVKRHANDLRLRSPGLRLPNFLAAGAHDTVRLVARLRGADLALTAETGRRTEGAELRLGALAGWSLFFYRGGDLRNIVLQLLWSAVILVPLGYWASRAAGSGLPRGPVRDHRRVLTWLLTVALALVGGVVVVPLALGYRLPSAWELTSVLTALAGGWWAATLARGEGDTRAGARGRRPSDLASAR